MQTYLSMVNLLDNLIGNLTQQLKDKGFWDNTVLVFSSDSASMVISQKKVIDAISDGGPLGLEESGGNNYPLRGGKYSEFEGTGCGVR